jgi:hypothetical protein
MEHYGSTSGSGQNPTEQVKDEVQQKTSEVMDQARQTTGQAMDQARESAFTMLNQQKGRAAEGLGSVASALRQTGETLEEQDQGMLGQYAQRAADQVEQIADQLRNRDVDEILYEVEGFARREPEIFLGGAVLLGLLAARFLKSSNARRQSMRGYEPGQGSPRYGYGSSAAQSYPYSQRYSSATGQYSGTGYPGTDFPQGGEGQSDWGSSQSTYRQGSQSGQTGSGQGSSSYGQGGKMSTGGSSSSRSMGESGSMSGQRPSTDISGSSPKSASQVSGSSMTSHTSGSGHMPDDDETGVA